MESKLQPEKANLPIEVMPSAMTIVLIELFLVSHGATEEREKSAMGPVPVIYKTSFSRLQLMVSPHVPLVGPIPSKGSDKAVVIIIIIIITMLKAIIRILF